jgi:hypothetical protein
VETSSVAMVDLAARPDLRGAADALVSTSLPAFVTWASPGNWRWHLLYADCPRHQVAALDAAGRLVAVVHSAPIDWDGEVSTLPRGYDDALVRATGDTRPSRPSTACLLSVCVSKAVRGRGLVQALILEMKRRAESEGFRAVIAPLRPTHKAAYPFVPMADYVEWKTPAGEPFDPWLRTHVAMGAEILGIADRSLVVTQPRARWEQVAQRDLSAPGRHSIEGALVPIEVDERGMGTYAEPNVWICHWVGTARTGDTSSL